MCVNLITFNVSGAKNMSLAALPIPLITNAQIQFVNLPNITDVNIESEINNHLGIVSFKRNKYTTFINGNLYKYIVPKNLGSKLRSSLYYLGALLSRFGKEIGRASCRERV